MLCYLTDWLILGSYINGNYFFTKIILRFSTVAISVGWYWVHGLVQPSHPSVRCGTTWENHRCLPWPVFMVRGWQKASVSSMGQASWYWTSTTANIQMVPRLADLLILCKSFLWEVIRQVLRFHLSSKTNISKLIPSWSGVSPISALHYM